MKVPELIGMVQITNIVLASMKHLRVRWTNLLSFQYCSHKNLTNIYKIMAI